MYFVKLFCLYVKVAGWADLLKVTSRFIGIAL